MLLQQLASKKAAAAFYTILALALVWYVAAGRNKAAVGGAGTDPQTTIVAGGSSSTSIKADQIGARLPTKDSSSTSASTSSSSSSVPVLAESRGTGQYEPVNSSDSTSRSEVHIRCPYGALPGTWVSGAPTGAKWQLLDPDCQLKNWLAVYAAAAAAAGGDSTAAAAAAADNSDAEQELLPSVNMLLLSDSVDRYIVQHVCDYLRGVKHTIKARQQHMQPPAPEAPIAAAAAEAGAGGGDAAAGTSSSGSEAAVVPDSVMTSSSSSSSDSSSSSAPGPSNLNATAYAFHTCQLPEGVQLKLASSYFPGVHPTGPFHR
jgi:hypothetical protein